jgi:hypothetical protein
MSRRGHTPPVAGQALPGQHRARKRPFENPPAGRPRMPRKMPESYRRIARVAVRAGWRIERTARHLAWVSPAGQRVISPATPSDHRSSRDLAAGLRRAGLVTRPRQARRRAAGARP